MARTHARQGGIDDEGARSLAGRGVVVAGGGSGLGAVICHELAMRGAEVAVVDADGAAAQDTARRMAAVGGSAIAYAAGAESESAVRAAIEDAECEFGRLDALVHCAVIGTAAAAGGAPVDVWDRRVQSALRSAFLHARLALPHLHRHGRGDLVSVMAVQGREDPRRTAWSASHWTLVGLSEALAQALERERVGVTAIVASDVLPARSHTRDDVREIVCACDPLDVASTVAEALAGDAPGAEAMNLLVVRDAARRARPA